MKTLIIMANVTDKTPFYIDAETARAIVGIGQENLGAIYPGYDPLKRHRHSDPNDGTSSRFFGDTMPEFDDALIELRQGNQPGSWTVVAHYSDNVGEYVKPAAPVAGHVKIVEDENGHGLQARPCGDLEWSKPEPRETAAWTGALTPETGPDGGTFLVLASAYPGEPDPRPDMSGLKAGDIIDAAEVRRRHLRVRAS